METVEQLPNSSQSSSSEQEKMNIYLKVTKTVAMKLSRSDTIGKLKAAMREKEGVSEKCQEVYYGGKCLKDDGTLVDCGIQDNSTLHVVLQTSGVVKLIVKISSKQKNIEVEAKRHDTVHNVKLMIQAKEGLHSNTYTLLYAGKLLEDGTTTLASLGIKDEATLNLVFNPRDMVTLSIKLPTGEIVKNEVKILFTVRDVKEIVESMFGFPASEHNLVYGGQPLEDSLTLASYKMNDESILEIFPRGFQIFVKLWSGKTLTLDVYQQDTVACVKSKILKKLGDAVNSLGRYYLVYAGKYLEDDQDLARLGVEKLSTLYTIVRLSTSFRVMKLSEIYGRQNLRRSTTIGHLKELVGKKLEKPVKELVLLNGNALRDDRPIAYYGILMDTKLIIAI